MTSKKAFPAMPGNPLEALTESPVMAYALDAVERNVLFVDALRRRANSDVDHLKAGEPPLLKFEHELVLDGRTLPRPCNYALLHILPPPEHPLNPKARPLVVVDPRAGHGPGIGGFKNDSEVGVALRAGHPVYFVMFRAQPEEGQTLADVMLAEARFLEEVAARHPKCKARPAVIGNCQAGWAMAMLASLRPELFGPLMMVGAPLAYWSGGSTMNPMRYSGATLGGSWLASMTADMAGDRFDGAHLVQNFESLNPANSLWGKYHKVWAKVDTEAERFLEFERWWGGIFRMTGSEIETIVENLFVGNRLARGEVQLAGRRVDLRNITSPVVVFASWGDNITPPPQALNWIIDTWGNERAIAAAGRVIVYVLHENVGHLGIFVGADIARKEHDQIVNSLDVIDNLPPGLYEMKLRRKDGEEAQRWEDLEPGTYTVNFEHRTMDDLRTVNPEGRDEEKLFSTVAKVSELNTGLYKTLLRPWVRAMAPRAVGEAMLALHPLRWQRQMFADSALTGTGIEQAAEQIRAHRHALPDDHPMVQLEKGLSDSIETSLNLYRDLRDRSVVNWTRLMFGPLGVGAWLPPDELDEVKARARAEADLEAARAEVLAHIAEGGFTQAVCRIVLAGMVSIGSFERRSFRIARLLTDLQAHGADAASDADEWHHLMMVEARIAAIAPIEALNALGEMLPDLATRERALAVAAAVMMIEPTLYNPRSEIIELLINTLEADPDRVIELARRLTSPIEHVAAKPRPKAKPATPAVKAKAAVAKPAAKKPVASKVSASRKTRT